MVAVCAATSRHCILASSQQTHFFSVVFSLDEARLDVFRNVGVLLDVVHLLGLGVDTPVDDPILQPRRINSPVTCALYHFYHHRHIAASCV